MDTFDPVSEHCEHCDAIVKKGTTCPRSLPCRTCRAMPGAPCVRPSGHRAMTLHAKRIFDAEDRDYKAGLGPHPATIV